MNIQTPIQKLHKLGQMPDVTDERATNEMIEMYDQLIQEIKYPINHEEAKILVGLFPENGLHEIEQTLLHAFESVYKQIEIGEYRMLIQQCPSNEWKEILITRLENSSRSIDRKRDVESGKAILCNILKEDKNVSVTTTFNVWVSGAPILFAYTDKLGGWFFSEKEGEIDIDDSFLAQLGQILQLDETLKTIPEIFANEKVRREGNIWIKY